MDGQFEDMIPVSQNMSRSTAKWLLPALATAMTVVSFGAFSAGATLAAGPSSAPGDKVTLCHLTGDGTFVEITVAASAAENGHGKHPGDIIPAPEAGCPTGSPTPTTEPAGGSGSSSEAGNPEKVSVCHRTGNGSYVKIRIARAGWDNGHSKHEGDILLASPQDACPATTAVLSGVEAPGTSTADVALCHLDASGSYAKLTVSRTEWDSIHALEGSDFLFTAEESIPCSEGVDALVAAMVAASLARAEGSPPQVGVISSDANGELPQTGNGSLALAVIAASLCAIGVVTVRSTKRRPAQIIGKA